MLTDYISLIPVVGHEKKRKPEIKRSLVEVCEATESHAPQKKRQEEA